MLSKSIHGIPPKGPNEVPTRYGNIRRLEIQKYLKSAQTITSPLNVKKGKNNFSRFFGKIITSKGKFYLITLSPIPLQRSPIKMIFFSHHIVVPSHSSNDLTQIFDKIFPLFSKKKFTEKFTIKHPINHPYVHSLSYMSNNSTRSLTFCRAIGKLSRPPPDGLIHAKLSPPSPPASSSSASNPNHQRYVHACPKSSLCARKRVSYVPAQPSDPPNIQFP